MFKAYYFSFLRLRPTPKENRNSFMQQGDLLLQNKKVHVRMWNRENINSYPPAKPGVLHMRAKPCFSGGASRRWYGLPLARV
ncbi:hypothetical protein, partial [Faecalispora jeddahensis]|uniref:hypothetical protein n=1 Tax=Faecalispora jeddahensis TaxID=1414721 RepID=UPI0019D57FAF